MGHMGNGAYGQCGDRGQWGTGDMGHMGNEAHRGYGVQVWATCSIVAQGISSTRGMGHMVNRSHGQWGTWAMGHRPHTPVPPLSIGPMAHVAYTPCTLLPHCPSPLPPLHNGPYG